MKLAGSKRCSLIRNACVREELVKTMQPSRNARSLVRDRRNGVPFSLVLFFPFIFSFFFFLSRCFASRVTDRPRFPEFLAGSSQRQLARCPFAFKTQRFSRCANERLWFD